MEQSEVALARSRAALERSRALFDRIQARSGREDDQVRRDQANVNHEVDTTTEHQAGEATGDS